MAKDDARLQVVLEAKIDKLTEKLGQANAAIYQSSNKMQRDIDAAAKRVSRSMEKDMAGSVQRAERQIGRSSAGISSSLKAMAGTLAAGVSVRAVQNLADGYTRYTNQLKVAGLEGEGLAKTQQDLFGIAQKYGVELESVGTLFGRLSQTSKELGASQGDLLRFTNGVAAALKVQGGSADSTKGALLQLSQALGGQIVRAEEFNSINEGARPLLQAVANGIDRFGGSVAKLRGEVILGKVTSQEFFQGFLRGSKDLEAQAEKANLTIAASFTVLNNALGKYVGETDASLSATQRVSEAIIKLADNLDKIIPAITTLAVLVGTRYVVALGAKTVATVASTAADVRAALAVEALDAANARLVASGGAATASIARETAAVSGLAVASGVATRGASALAAVMGGPLGLAITAIVGGLALLLESHSELSRRNQQLIADMGGAKTALDEYEKAAIDAANASGEGAVKAREHAEAMRQEAGAAVTAARALRDKAVAETNAAFNKSQEQLARATAGRPTSQANLTLETGDYFNAQKAYVEARDRAAAATKASKDAEARYQQILSGATVAGGGGGGSSGGTPAAKRGSAPAAKGSTGPTAAEVADKRVELYLQQQLELARATGDDRTTQALEDHLLLRQETARLSEAGVKNAEDEAEAYVAALQNARAVAAATEAAQKRTTSQSELDALINEKVEEERQARQELADDLEKQTFESTRNGILDGLYAASQGNFADYLASRLRQKVFESVADGLAQGLLTKGGGLSGLLNAGAQLLGIGRNANGTDGWRGGLSMVGERGPELVNLPKGAQVIPNDILRGLAQIRMSSPGASHATLKMEVNVVGAIGADGIAAIAKREAQRGAAFALQAANKGYPTAQARQQRLGTT